MARRVTDEQLAILAKFWQDQAARERVNLEGRAVLDLRDERALNAELVAACREAASMLRLSHEEKREALQLYHEAEDVLRAALKRAMGE